MTRPFPKRSLIFLILLFTTVSLLTFFGFKNTQTSTAASTANFRPGHIISDYMMGNYNSMTEADIQAFLTKKNPCANRDYNLYLKISARSPHLKWNFKDGHFVCISEELFGDGEVTGSGETAARIIWQAAQDYKINPQVLIVLLQKEQGLITDPYPQSRQYRSATGYGCPDTAPCSEQYYGFKNQIRKAAALFRTVLNGGWTNYPVGNNYIQYNPNANCGGTWVNIENRATSALYRYTPYQPNAGALAAGYGTAYCGAYGNRNFYLYFMDWFGDPTSLGWVELETPRHLTAFKDTGIIDRRNNQKVKTMTKGTTAFYTSKIIGPDGNWCLRSDINEKNQSLHCVSFSDLKDTEWSWYEMETPRYLHSKNKKLINPNTKKEYNTSIPDILFFNKRIFLSDGDMCLKSTDQKFEYGCVLYSKTKEVEWKALDMQYPRTLSSEEGSKIEFINPTTNKVVEQVDKPQYFDKKIILPDGRQCLGGDNVSSKCSIFNNLNETWVDMEYPRVLVVKDDAINKINAYTMENDSLSLGRGLTRTFVSKILAANDSWCLRTEYDEALGTDNCIEFNKLKEGWNYFDTPRPLTIKEDTYKINSSTTKYDYTLHLVSGMKRNYVARILLPDDSWCLRTEYDEALGTDNCIKESSLRP